MKEISLFDVIGPNMIGPSSSHTAGALRIAQLARKIACGEIVKVKFTLYGSFSQTYQGHGTDKALLGGIMGFDTEDERIRDSFAIADSKGLEYEFVPYFEPNDYHPNTVLIESIDTRGRSTSVQGASTGGGNVRIDQINGTEIFFTGEYHTMIVSQNDQPGVVAHIAEVLTKHNINIAFMRVYRESKGQKAYTIIEADEHINRAVLDDISNHQHILDERIIEI